MPEHLKLLMARWPRENSDDHVRRYARSAPSAHIHDGADIEVAGNRSSYKYR